MNILFMCVANSARSQLAEGLAKRLFGANSRVESAGSQPGTVNPLAIQALAERNIDISRHHSKSFQDLPVDFTSRLDYVITLCAEEVCPFVVSDAKRLHWPLPDPARNQGTKTEQLDRFRQTRDVLMGRLQTFANEAGIKVEKECLRTEKAPPE